MAFPIALIPVAISAISNLITLRRRIIDIREEHRNEDSAPPALKPLSPDLVRDKINDPNRMKRSFQSDKLFQAVLEQRGLTKLFDSYLSNTDLKSGKKLAFNIREDMHWRFMALYYVVKDAIDTNGRPVPGTAGIDGEDIEKFLVLSRDENGKPRGGLVLRAVAETLVEFLGDNAGAFLGKSPNRQLVATILTEFADNTDLETDSSQVLVKKLIGSTAVAAIDHGEKVADHPAAVLLISALGRARHEQSGEPPEAFVSRITSHAGFTAVLSDWLSNAATDPYLVELVAELGGLVDDKVDLQDPSSLPPDLQMLLGGLSHTMVVVADNIGENRSLNREEHFRSVFSAVLAGVSRNSSALLEQELAGNRFMGDLLQAVISEVSAAPSIRRNDLIAPVFGDLLNSLSGVVGTLGQDRTLTRAQEIVQDFARRVSNEGLAQTLSEIDRLATEKGGQVFVAELFAIARRRADVAHQPDIERMHHVAQVLLDEVPGILRRGLSTQSTLRVMQRIFDQISQTDDAEQAFIMVLAPQLIQLVDDLTNGSGQVDPDTIEALYLQLIDRFETDALIWRALADQGRAGALVSGLQFALQGDQLPDHLSVSVRAAIADAALDLLSAHGLSISDAVDTQGDPDEVLASLVHAIVEQAITTALSQLGHGARGADLVPILRALMQAALSQDQPAVLNDPGEILADFLQSLPVQEAQQ